MPLECSKCGVYACYTGKLDKIPKHCPMRTEEEIYKKSIEEYEKDFIRKIALNAARVEAEGYLKWTRIEETIEFAKRCGFKKIGIAFCIGLRNEARILTDILEKNGFEVCSVVFDILPALKGEDSRFSGVCGNPRGRIMGLQSVKDCGVCQHPVKPVSVMDTGYV